LTTKQKIIEKALTLFSEKGYEAVTVAQIAEAVDIKAPSLYKHYKSKQDIFNAILQAMQQRYEEQAAELNMDGSDVNINAAMFSEISEQQLLYMVNELFQYFVHDEYVCKFRKMLTVEQYKNRELADLYSHQYVDGTLAYHTALFERLIQVGLLQGDDAKALAIQFYAPLYFFVTVCDRQPEREPEMLQLLELHVKQFNKTYRKGNV